MTLRCGVESSQTVKVELHWAWVLVSIEYKLLSAPLLLGNVELTLKS